MKKTNKVLPACAIALTIIVQCIIILFIFYATKWSKDWYPSAQKNTVWKTEDNKISFSVGETSFPVYGTIQTDLGNIDVIFRTSTLVRSIDVYHLDNLEDIENNNPVDSLEFWLVKKIRKNKFVVTVKKTTYFEVGEEITFYKVEGE